MTRRFEALLERRESDNSVAATCHVCVDALNEMRILHNYTARYLHPKDRPDDRVPSPLAKTCNRAERALRKSFRRLYFQFSNTNTGSRKYDKGAELAVLAALYAQIKHRWKVFMNASDALLLRLPRRYEHPRKPTVDLISKELASIRADWMKTDYRHEPHNSLEKAKLKDFKEVR